jgi:hypothetical protein
VRGREVRECGVVFCGVLLKGASVESVVWCKSIGAKIKGLNIKIKKVEDVIEFYGLGVVGVTEKVASLGCHFYR